MMTDKPVSVISIYVSHNSEKYIKKFSDRHKGELGERVYIINSFSKDIDANKFNDFEVINVGKNIGFSAANNIGIKHGVRLDHDYFIIINPDVFLPPSWLNSVLKIVDDIQCPDAGVFTVPLLGYDYKKDCATGLVDSLGVDHTWYGRWFDIAQGDDVDVFDRKRAPYEVCAACGALMIIHKNLIHEILGSYGYVFNESFFMYKEDIELSLRVRKLRKKVMMIPSLPVYHCRGWSKSRANSSYWARELSARNELKMHLTYFWRYVPYSLIKYFYVRLIERFFF